MKWKKDQRFDCETYLETLAMGIHSPVAEEHVANCNFCRDIYYGGTDEFPNSLKDEAARIRAEKKRKARRKMLRLTGGLAASLLLGVAVGRSTVFRDSKSTIPNPARTLWLNTNASWDALWSSKGRPGIENRLVTLDTDDTVLFCYWVADRRYVALYDLLVAHLLSGSEPVQTAALLGLREVDPVDLKPHLESISRARSRFSDERIRTILSALLVDIEES